MYTTIAQFLVVQADLLNAFPGQLFNACQLLTFLFRLHYLSVECLCGFRIAVKVVVEIPFNDIRYIIPDGHAIGFHQLGAQLGLGLRLKYRFLHFDADRSHDG